MTNANIIVKAYEYSELSEIGKYNALSVLKNKFYFHSCYDFNEMLKSDLECDFPRSGKFDLSYDLSYSQGDFLAIDGCFSFVDLLTLRRRIPDLPTDYDDVVRRIIRVNPVVVAALCRNGNDNVYTRYSSGYSKYLSYVTFDDKIDLDEDGNFVVLVDNKWIPICEYDEYGRGVFLTITNLACELIKFVIGYYKDLGYRFFYETPENEIEEYCSENGFLFTENGKEIVSAYNPF